MGTIINIRNPTVNGNVNSTPAELSFVSRLCPSLLFVFAIRNPPPFCKTPYALFPPERKRAAASHPDAAALFYHLSAFAAMISFP